MYNSWGFVNPFRNAPPFRGYTYYLKLEQRILSVFMRSPALKRVNKRSPPNTFGYIVSLFISLLHIFPNAGSPLLYFS